MDTTIGSQFFAFQAQGEGVSVYDLLIFRQLA